MQCERCGGTGQGTLYERCPACRGRGRFEPPDYAAILRAIRGRKGLRSRPPAGAREYYVWRLARFYGGQDVTMPVLAFVRILGDPYQADLDALARSVAKRVFGTDLAGSDQIYVPIQARPAAEGKVHVQVQGTSPLNRSYGAAFNVESPELYEFVSRALAGE